MDYRRKRFIINRRSLFAAGIASVCSRLSRLFANESILIEDDVRSPILERFKPLEKGSCLDVVTFSPDGLLLAANERDPSFAVEIDLEADIEPDFSNPTLAINGRPYRLNVWNTKDGKLVASIKTRPFPMQVIAFSNDAKFVSFGGARNHKNPGPSIVADYFRDPTNRGDLLKLEGGSCELWQLDNTKKEAEIETDTGMIVALNLDKFCVILDTNGIASVWDRSGRSRGVRLNPKKGWRLRQNLPNDIARASISRNQKICAAFGTISLPSDTNSLHHDLCIWNLDTNTVFSLPDEDQSFHTFSIDDQGTRICIGLKNHKLILHDIVLMKVLLEIPTKCRSLPKFVKFDKNSRFLVIAAETIKVFDILKSSFMEEFLLTNSKVDIRAVSIEGNIIQVAQGGTFMYNVTPNQTISKIYVPLTITCFESKFIHP